VSGARIHIRNLLANWVGHGANMVVLFFLSPFVVGTLGETEYGIWSLLTVLTGYMGLFDLGVRSSTGRYIILYLGRGDHESLDQTIRTGLGFFTVVGVLMLVAGVVLGLGFPYFFRTAPQEYHFVVAVLLPVLAVNAWVSAVAAVLSSVLVAHERFDLARAVDLVILAVRTVGTILALLWDYGIIGLTVVTLACGVVALAGNYWLAMRIHPTLRVWPLAMIKARLRELFGYGIPACICGVADKITGQTSMVVIGVLISVAAVTVYSVGAMLVFYSTAFIGLIGTTFFPPVQQAVARSDTNSVRWYYYRQVRLALVFGLPAYIGFANSALAAEACR
jgi:O-antigen/teichoic acid export membrane protein